MKPTEEQEEKIRKITRKFILKNILTSLLYGLGMILGNIVFIALRMNYIQDDDFLRAGSFCTAMITFIGLSSELKEIRDIFIKDTKQILSDRE